MNLHKDLLQKQAIFQAVESPEKYTGYLEP